MTMSLSLFCVINFLYQIGCIYGQYHFAYYKNNITDCNLSGNILLETTASSLSSCCYQCVKDRRCQAVSYKRTDGTCSTHGVCPPEEYGYSIHGQTDPDCALLCLDYPNRKPATCSDIQRRNSNSPDGVYTISPDGKKVVHVYCDMTTEGGGWTVFQRRFDGSLYFYRGWEDYKNGFGDPNGEYWLGNDVLHDLTKNGTCKLRIDMVTLTDDTGYAAYSNFTIGSEQEGYALNFTQYLGKVGDALTYHKGQMFSTKDRENDKHDVDNCAVKYYGAWWYNACQYSNLNGLYGGATGRYLRWLHWKAFAAEAHMKNTKMMIK